MEQLILSNSTKVIPAHSRLEESPGATLSLRTRKRTVDAPSVLKTDLQNPPARGQQWKETTQEQDEFPANILETYFVMQEIESSVLKNI